METRLDPQLLQAVRRFGRFDTEACYNCGSCAAVCELAEDGALFPRRAMRLVQTGMRQELRASLEPWLCYYCGDCATSCPRQTEPGEAMMTLRRFLMAEYDWTGITAKLYTSRAWQVGALVLVGALVTMLIALFHGPMLATVPVPLNTFAPAQLVHRFDLTVAGLLSVLLVSFVWRMFALVVKGNSQTKVPLISFLEELKVLFWQAATQKKFLQCASPGYWFRSRWLKHFLMVSGYVIMLLLVVVFLEWFQTDNIYPLSHPQRWLGYYATGVLLVFLSEIIWGRLRRREQIHKFSDLSDWVFPVMLWLTAASGLAVHAFRYWGWPLTTYYAYAGHLAVAVTMLIVVYPFGKWLHVVYRPLALYFHAVKLNALRRQARSCAGNVALAQSQPQKI